MARNHHIGMGKLLVTCAVLLIWLPIGTPQAPAANPGWTHGGGGPARSGTTELAAGPLDVVAVLSDWWPRGDMEGLRGSAVQTPHGILFT